SGHSRSQCRPAGARAPRPPALDRRGTVRISSGTVTPFYISKNEIYLHGKEARRKVTFISSSRQLLRERRPAGNTCQSHNGHGNRRRSRDYCHGLQSPVFNTCITSVHERTGSAFFPSRRAVFFEQFSGDILGLREIEVIMPGPGLAVAEQYCRDAVVALPHDKVGKPRDLVHYRLFRDLEFMAEEVNIPPEIPDGRKPAPSDSVPGLPPPERAPAGIRDDHTNLFSGELPDLLPELRRRVHRVGRKEDHHAVIDITLVDARPYTDVAEREFGKDEGVFHDNILRGIEHGLDKTGIFLVELSKAQSPF